MEEPKRVRIVDIAEELGLSTATVSNVIHGKTSKVSEETVRRVQELLEEREYIPSMAGILLAQNNSKIVGIIVNDSEKYEGHVLEDGFIAASLNALARELEAADYFMMVKVTKQWNEIARFASMWNMAGLVLIGFCEQDYQKLRSRMRIPFVIYDGFLENASGLVNLVIDDYDGGRQMGTHLKNLGHERVLCIADNDICMDRRRFEGLQSVLPDAELLVIPMKKEKRMEFYRERKSKILGFTAVFAASDYYAIDFMQFLGAEGILVPSQISVAGFDDSMLAGQVEPTLTTVGQNHGERARLAVELLERLRAHEKVLASYMIPLQLIARKSTGQNNQK